MTSLTSFLVLARARGVFFAAAATTAALIAVLLALATPAPHAGAQTDTMADLTINVTVPQLDGTTANTNIWSGTSLDVTIARASGADANCSLSADAVVTYEVDAMGAVATTDGDLPAQLISMTAGSVACDYTVTFPDVPALASGTDLSGTLTTPTAATWNASSLTATGAYVLAADVTFTPDATITVPAGSAAASFAVPVTSATTGCSGNPTAATLNYTVAGAAATTATAEGNNPSLIAYPMAATASTDVCAYTAAFPATEDQGTTLARQAAPAPDGDFTGTDQAISVTYAADASATFEPTVSLSVPVLDGVTAMTNIWATETFDVTIAPDTASSTVTGCDASVTVTFTVQTDGSVTAGSNLPATLTGTTAAGETCGYTVTYPAAPTDTAGGDLDWTMTAPATTEVALSASSATAAGAYTVGEVTFVPDATVTVPAGNAGLVITASVASATAGCSGNPTAVTLTYNVADAAATTAAADANNAPLIAYPASATMASDACSYTVAFADGETLEPQAGASTSASHQSQTISATYEVPVNLPPPVGTTVAAPGTAPTISTPGVSGSGVGSDIADDDDEDAFEGFEASPTQRVPISVSLALPATSFDADATVELLVSSPGACGSDMAAFGGVPAQVGLAYAVSATSGAMADVIAAGAQTLAQFAERGTQQEPCALRVTVLSAPAGCTLAGGTTDSEGRSYTEQTWRTGTETLALTPSMACGGVVPEPEPEPEAEEATDAAADDDDADGGSSAGGGDATADDDDANGDAAADDDTDANGNGDGTNGEATDGSGGDAS